MFYQFNHYGSPEYLKTEWGKDFSFPMHLHMCFEVIILLSGEMTVTVDDKEYILKPNEAILVFPNQLHSLHSVSSEHTLCIFSPTLVQSFATSVSGKLPVNNHFKPDSHLINALSTLAEASLIEKKGVLYQLCGQFDKNTCYAKKDADKASLLHRIFEFVEENYNSDCSLQQLSSSIGYDYSYISRIFKKTTGFTFNAYVNLYRISRACYMMENTDLTILQCAYDSGFSSLRSFNRNFKEQLNMTPHEYRNRAK